MSFLAAWALAGVALLAVPLLLHVRRRRPDRRVPFPALRYLRRAGDATARSLRTRDLLLLALRVGLLAALVGAAAGPLVGRGGPADHPPSDLALVIDNSASTARLGAGAPLLERLVERARATLSAARAEDRFWIVPTVGTPLAAAAGAPRALAALAALEQTDGAADWRLAVARADGLLPRESGRHAEIQLLSDLQRSGLGPGWAATAASARSVAPAPAGGKVPLLAFDPGEPPVANRALTALRLSEGAAVPVGAAQAVHFRVAGAGGPGAAALTDTLSVRLVVDGRTAGATRIAGGREGAVRLPRLAAGPHHGRLEIEPSGLRADDARHFALTTVPAPVVERLGPPDSFLELALQTLRAAGRAAAPPPGAPADIHLIEGGGEVRPERLGRTVVLVPPRDPLDLPAFNQLLVALAVPWQVRPDTAAGALELELGRAAVPGEARVLWRYGLQGGGGSIADSALLRTGDGEPWAVRGRAGDRTYVLLASPLVPEASTLPASPSMIPFVEAILQRWSAIDAWPASDFEAGGSVALPAWADSVRFPGGAVRAVEGGAPFAAPRAGVYEVLGSDSRAFFAANVPNAESDLAPLPTRRLAELFPGRDVRTAGPAEAAWERAIYARRRGVDVAPWLLVAAALLAVVELGLATPGHSARLRASGPGRHGAARRP